MKKVLVSGCYDIIHGGHVEFFNQAKALGDYLIVSFADDNVLMKYKGRRSSIPTEHKKRILESLNMVDEVIVGNSVDCEGLDFIEHFGRVQPNILVATDDDKFKEQKTQLCLLASWGCEYVVLPKTLNFEKISTSEIIQWIKAPKEVPLRVDFAGGWLDVPKYAIDGAYIVNCAISPTVSLANWNYEIGGGLGGSAAYAMLGGKDAFTSELNLGVGWQDPAIIRETGMCVWNSGKTPSLDFKCNPSWLEGKMALLWTGKCHTTYNHTDNKRDYSLIKAAGNVARVACIHRQLSTLAEAINMSHKAQIGEGMDPLPELALARKYCGGGFGGYALYLFDSKNGRDNFVAEKKAITIEPYMR